MQQVGRLVKLPPDVLKRMEALKAQGATIEEFQAGVLGDSAYFGIVFAGRPIALVAITPDIAPAILIRQLINTHDMMNRPPDGQMYH